MLDQYREVAVRTASPTELVVRMYEGAIRHVRSARSAHQADKPGERGVALSKALAIVAELQQSLDFENGGEIARNLDALYLYVSARLLDANVRGRVEALDEALRVLEQLGGAWEEISRRPLAAPEQPR